jgi:hypothetical protein
LTGVGDGASTAASLVGRAESRPASLVGELESTETDASDAPPSAVVSELLHATSAPATSEEKARA